MHSARWARTMSKTVLPLMMDKSKCMAPVAPTRVSPSRWDPRPYRGRACRTVGIVLFERTRLAGVASRRADADEDIIKRVKVGADLSRRELVVRLYGVQISVLVRPVGVRNGGT